MWQSPIFAEWLRDSAEGSQSCGAAELQKDGGGGGVWVAPVQSGGVAKLQNGQLRNSRVTESQRWGVGKLGSCRVSGLQRYRATDLETGIVARLLSWRAAEVQSLEL